jgi:3-deoxy-D-manno-octulosonic-acid transferase
MEPAIWEKAVFFGPDMADFSEAAAALENRGGGFRVNDVAELGNEISMLQEDRNRLQQIQRLAGAAAREQLGAAERQADLINKSLTHINKVQT